MLSQLDSDRVGHDLTSMDFGPLSPVDRGVPPNLRIVVNGHLDIASSDALLYDFLEFYGCFLQLIHAGSPEQISFQ
jgi:hypothetical protein